MGNLFVISDTHFFHSKILEFERAARPFDSVEEMNEAMVDRWNAIVKKNDAVWHLGDVCFGSKKNLKIIDRLKGRKNLIMGNHDRYGVRLYAEVFGKIEAVRRLDGFLLSHIPIHPDSMYRFKGNVHGHLHSKRVTTLVRYHLGHGPDGCVVSPDGDEEYMYEVDERYKCVSVEHTGLAPIPWEEVRGDM